MADRVAYFALFKFYLGCLKSRMGFKFKTPGGERTWVAGFIIVIGLIAFVAGLALQKGNASYSITVGTVFLTCGIGLWFNQQWARWATFVLMVLVVFGNGWFLLTKP